MATLKKKKKAKPRQLKRSNGVKAKKGFPAKISHTVRTRLHAIIGFSELLLNKRAGDINREQREYLNDILSSSRDLLHLLKSRELKKSGSKKSKKKS